MRSYLAKDTRGSSQIRRGVTMIEIVITLLIMGIMAGTALPRLGHMLDSYRVKAATARLAADLAFAQKSARTTSTTETVTFDTALHRYTFSSIRDPISKSALYEVNLSQYPYSSRFGRLKLGSGSAITFNGYGLPDAAGKILIQSGQEFRILTIDGVTGRIFVEGS